VKVEYVAASSAMQMMMGSHLWIETLGTAEYFDNIHDADFSEGQ
jgi:hypothetical protein